MRLNYLKAISNRAHTIIAHSLAVPFSLYLSRPIFVRIFRIFFTTLVLAGILGGLSPVSTDLEAFSIPTLKWHHGGCRDTWCRTGWYASPAVADLDRDGRMEVIWTDYRILVLNGADGSTQWVVSNPGEGRGWPSVVVADIDGNQFPEIVTAHSGGYLSVYQGNGTPLPGWPRQPTPGNELRSLAVGDVDGDGFLEILTASTRPDNQWFLYNANGTIRPGWPVLSPDSNTNGYAAGCFNENVGLADLDGDGQLEMIGPNDTHYVAGYRHDGTPLRASPIYGLVNGQNKPWARVGFHLSQAVDLRGYANCAAGQEPLEPRPNFADSAPSFADLDGDGTLEIVIVGNQYDCRTNPYTSLYQLPYILKPDRTRWSGSGFNWETLPLPDGQTGPLSEDYNVIETVQPNPVIADLDGDGFKEILYSSYDGRLHAYWLDRTEHGSWPYRVSNPVEGFLRFASEPVVADLDNDGKAEVIFTTWTEKGSNAGGQLIILNYMGQLLHAVDLPRSGGSWDGALGAPTLADIDGDGDLEVVIGTVHTGLVAYTLPGTKDARVLWGTGRGSFLRTGQAANILGNIPSRVSFFYDLEQQRLSPAGYRVTPKNRGTTQPLHWTLTPAGNWVFATPLTGVTPASSFIIMPTNFATTNPAVYEGSLTLTVTDPPDTAGSPAQIPVTLHVVERVYPLQLPLLLR
jgi:hypothetical protein